MRCYFALKLKHEMIVSSNDMSVNKQEDIFIEELIIFLNKESKLKNLQIHHKLPKTHDAI